MEENFPKNRKEGNELTIIIVGMVFFLISTKWLYSHSSMFFNLWEKVYYPQAKIIAWFSTTLLGNGVNFLLGHTTFQANSLVKFIANTPANNFSGQFCWNASKFIGKYFLFVFVPVGGYLTFKTYCSTQGESIVYQKFNDANMLLNFARGDKKSQKNHQMEETSAVFNNEDIDERINEIVITKDFIQENQLLLNTKNKKIQLDTKKVLNCFTEQLGAQFISLESLVNSPYGWVVIEILKYIPEKYRQDVINLSVVGHRYDTTVLLSFLYGARNFGVVPSAVFVRLKNKYPALWYGLNNLGRKTVFAEGAGISAQYSHEVRLKNTFQQKPSLNAVEAAVKGLEEKFEQEKKMDGGN